TTGLTNSGVISLAGGATAQAKMTVNGAATNTGTVNVGANAVLTLNGASNILSGAIAGAGQVDVVGAATITGTLVQSGATLRFLGGLNDSGVVLANGGTLDIGATTVGAGAFQIGNGGVLDFAAGTPGGETVSFLSSTGTLALGDPAHFHALISGFGTGDVMDLTNILPSAISS